MLQENEKVEFEHIVTKAMQWDFGATFEDFTYLHYNDEYARRCGFEQRPVQGALISAIIVKDIVLTFGDSAILITHNLSFIKPVYPGNTFKIELYVLSNIRNKVIKLRTRVIIADKICYQGQTKIKVFEDIQESYFKDKKYSIDE